MKLLTDKEAAEKVYEDTCSMFGRENVEKYFGQFRAYARETLAEMIDAHYDAIDAAMQAFAGLDSAEDRNRLFELLDPALREAVLAICYIQHERLLLGEMSLSVEPPRLVEGASELN